MIKYFDDESLSVLQIRNKIVLNNLDFALSILKRYSSFYIQFEISDSTDIKELERYVYQENDDDENEVKSDEEIPIFDNLDLIDKTKLIKSYLEMYSYFEVPLENEGSKILEKFGIKD